ncbi:MAG TPA: hypothetical protein VGN86_11315 [Pyrinomonadaceae bacterium]|nr:hypothetical protein [Pyrinomonadaceae bacterium]
MLLKSLALLLLWPIIAINHSAIAQKIPSQDPGHKEYASAGDLKFSVPDGFALKSSTASLAFMFREDYGLGLFVAIPARKIDDDYLINLSNDLAGKLFPRETGFDWKIIPDTSKHMVSDFQTGGGNTKGLHSKRLVQTDYIILNVKNRDVIVGYVMRLGHDNDAKFLFDFKGPAGMSMPGWYAQAHVIASVTGEKYERINPGTVIIGTPAKKPN